MTRGWNNPIRHCNQVVQCSVCNEKVTNETEFSKWMRSHPLLDSRIEGFDSENLDYVWFAFRQAWFIMLEEKRQGKPQSSAQKDTHGIINQMLRIASGSIVNTMRGKRAIEYRGYYLVQFQNTNPNDSTWIKVNGQECQVAELLVLLLYGKLVTLSKNINLDTLYSQLNIQIDTDYSDAVAIAEYSGIT